MSAGASPASATPAKKPPVPPDGYKLVRYALQPDGKSGTYDPAISVDEFTSLRVWIPDLGAWKKPKYLIGDEPRWLAVKLRKR